MLLNAHEHFLKRERDHHGLPRRQRVFLAEGGDPRRGVRDLVRRAVDGKGNEAAGLVSGGAAGAAEVQIEVDRLAGQLRDRAEAFGQVARKALSAHPRPEGERGVAFVTLLLPTVLLLRLARRGRERPHTAERAGELPRQRLRVRAAHGVERQREGQTVAVVLAQDHLTGDLRHAGEMLVKLVGGDARQNALRRKGSRGETNCGGRAERPSLPAPYSHWRGNSRARCRSCPCRDRRQKSSSSPAQAAARNRKSPIESRCRPSSLSRK